MDREARLKYKRMKIATKRAQMSKEEKEAKRKENRERMARNRSQKSEEEKVIIRKENKERMARKREAETEAKIEDWESNDEKQKNLYARHEKKFNRLYKRRIRGERSDAEHEYEKIYNLLCMRKLRSFRSADKHLIDKHESKLCMRLLKKEGRLKPFLKRNFREIHELDI